jgi:ATP-dependent RNA helicase HelY
MRDKDRLVGEIGRATGSIAAIFDRRCAVLRSLGYVSGHGEETEVTELGRAMRTLYAENDIVMAECLRDGVWAALTAPALAAVVSSLLYNGRREDETRTPKIPGGPTGVLGTALRDTQRVWARIDDLHTEHRLPSLPAPQWGIVSAIHGWAQGKTVDAVLEGTDIAPGDMVRWSKQVIDALEQIAASALDARLADKALSAVSAMRRGVVAY